MFVFNVTVNNGISEEQIMGLKETFEAGKAEIKAAVAAEAAQHAAKLDEIIAQLGSLSQEELAAGLAEIANDVRGIVPDAAPAPEPVDPGPSGVGE